MWGGGGGGGAGGGGGGGGGGGEGSFFGESEQRQCAGGVTQFTQSLKDMNLNYYTTSTVDMFAFCESIRVAFVVFLRWHRSSSFAFSFTE